MVIFSFLIACCSILCVFFVLTCAIVVAYIVLEFMQSNGGHAHSTNDHNSILVLADRDVAEYNRKNKTRKAVGFCFISDCIEKKVLLDPKDYYERDANNERKLKKQESVRSETDSPVEDVKKRYHLILPRKNVGV